MTLLLCFAISGLTPAAPQQTVTPPPVAQTDTAQTRAEGSTLQPADLPVSIDRIQRALARPPSLRLTGNKLVFRIEILGKKPTIEDILGRDYLKGPVAYGGMTHSEFLNMVTPKDVQGYAAFNNREGMVVAATSIALQWAVLKALHKYEDAKKEHEREAARQEVLDALAALDRARQKAGLPPK